MQLTGPQLKRLNRILAHAFPSYPELQRMVRFSLGVQLNTLVQSANITQAVFELADWADTHDKLTELIRGAQEENSDHVELRAFAVEVGVLAAPVPAGPAAVASSYRTLVVDQMHRGDYSTISEAISAAAPGDRINVRPGIYTEGLVIDKPLEIVGEGDRTDIVVQISGANVIRFQTSAGRVQNLTLRQTGNGWYGVDIRQGHLALEECDIRSAGWSCVAIHRGAYPHLRRNHIHGSNQARVYIYEQGQGLLEDNDITANANDGVAIRSGGNPTLRRNSIHNGQASGVSIYEQGQGLLEDNDIAANARAGVAIKFGGNPTLRGNRIRKNGYEAVWISDGGAGTFENNDLRDNVRGAWDIDPACLPNVKRSVNTE